MAVRAANASKKDLPKIKWDDNSVLSSLKKAIRRQGRRGKNPYADYLEVFER